MNIENISSFHHALTAGMNLFLGAGFSVLARDAESNPLPVGQQLAAELCETFNAKHLSSLDLAQLYTILARDHRDEVNHYLKSRYTVKEFDERYRALWRVEIETIFTTNIDSLPQRLFSQCPSSYLNDSYAKGPSYADRRAIDFFSLHGSVLDDTRPYTFGTLEVASAFDADQDRWRYFRHRIQAKPTLFWGYSLRDAATLGAMRDARSDALKSAWIQVREADSDSPELNYFRALGMQIIVADTDELLEHIDSAVSTPTQSPTKVFEKRTDQLFPGDGIPDAASVPSRPIADFFKGAAPGWSDIFSPSLRQTSHYRTVLESVRSGKTTIVTGIPGSGKTTMLMQVASELAFEGHKLMLDGPTRAKAEMIVRLLDGTSALVVIDNFTNDVDALDVFSQAPNIRVVAGDRDFSLSSALHRLDRSTSSIVDITDLTNSDLDDLWDSIPLGIRKPSAVRPRTSQGIRPSLFEFVQANVHGPTLRSRFERALKNLQDRDPRLAEVLLLAAYVHWCRTPLSMDMSLGYWGDRIGSYQEMYEFIKRAGATLGEYEGDLADEQQDYFAARSLLAAETVLWAANGSQLRSMLECFHSNVSSARIVGYHIFRRRAYDSVLFDRAFHDVRDACALYDDIYARDSSPYTLQQKALLLSRRGMHTDAFEAIDRAIATAHRSNWTIRNAHAQILFRANMSLATSNSEARALLDRAMRILVDCHREDRRRAKHALVYGEFAVDYAQLFRDTASLNYLKQAERWLSDVIGSESWIRRARPLRNRVLRSMADIG